MVNKASGRRPTFIQRFILGPSFAEAELVRPVPTLTAFPEAADSLLSGFFCVFGPAFFLFWWGRRWPGVKEQRGRGWRTSMVLGQAVKELRDGSSVSMVLGLGIVTFDLLDLRLHAYSIRRYTPGLLSGALEGGEVEIGELEKQILSLIFMDRCNCLVR